MNGEMTQFPFPLEMLNLAEIPLLKITAHLLPRSMHEVSVFLTHKDHLLQCYQRSHTSPSRSPAAFSCILLLPSPSLSVISISQKTSISAILLYKHTPRLCTRPTTRLRFSIIVLNKTRLSGYPTEFVYVVRHRSSLCVIVV